MLKEFGSLTVLSVDELAEKTGLPADEISKICDGGRDRPGAAR